MKTLRCTIRLLTFAVGVVSAATADAQNYEWAEQMFSKREHDFGVVARGSDAKYRLEITNKYKEDVHISSITTSCGCTAVRPSKETLVSREKAYIEITMDTRKFTHEKNSSVTVVFDKPLYATVRIPIKAYIRTDVVLSPGGAEFGGISRGTDSERKISIAYAGRQNWTIRDVVNKSEHLTARLEETSRGNNRVNYDLYVTVKGSAPLGDLREQITLITDDQGNPQIPVLVEARVESDYTVNPNLVDFGTVSAGARVTKNVVIRGKKPFTVAKIECDTLSMALEARLPKEPKAVQIIPITLTAPSAAGPFTEKLHILVDGVNEAIDFKAYFKVIADSSVEAKPQSAAAVAGSGS